jgi:hypothetical protein
VNGLLQKVANLIHRWKLLCRTQKMPELESRLTWLKSLAKRPSRLAN